MPHERSGSIQVLMQEAVKARTQLAVRIQHQHIALAACPLEFSAITMLGQHGAVEEAFKGGAFRDHRQPCDHTAFDPQPLTHVTGWAGFGGLYLDETAMDGVKQRQDGVLNGHERLAKRKDCAANIVSDDRAGLPARTTPVPGGALTYRLVQCPRSQGVGRVCNKVERRVSKGSMKAQYRSL